MAEPAAAAPLAERMRPRRLEQLHGQPHLFGPGAPLRQAIERDQPPSMVLWGPPGSGKTTLARVIAEQTGADWHGLSAVLAGVKDVRAAVEQARAALRLARRTIVFVDEVHRFNKAQQDALLPHIEDGTFIFIGATTENPSFELNNALLSRTRLYVLQALDAGALGNILDAALADPARGLGGRFRLDDEAHAALLKAADGDARRLLNLLEAAAEQAEQDRPGTAQAPAHIDAAVLQRLGAAQARRFDRQGDGWYDLISALHKSVRASSPDAALYYLARLLDGGCDPAYVGRRLLRMATEDIGLADPRAVAQVIAAWESYERLGAPEGALALAQATVYLAAAPKSNAVYQAWNAALADVREHGSLEPPLHLRNAPTETLRRLGHGRGYRYDHDEGGHAAGQALMPDALGLRQYYEPTGQGIEARIGERLQRLRAATSPLTGRTDNDR